MDHKSRTILIETAMNTRLGYINAYEEIELCVIPWEWWEWGRRSCMKELK